MNSPAQFLNSKVVISNNFYLSWFEETKTYRQYFGASAFSIDEAFSLSDNQHCFYKKPSYTSPDRTMGNVHVHCRADEFFLGYRNNSIPASPVSQKQNLF